MKDYDLKEWPKIRNILVLFLKQCKPHILFSQGEFDITKLSERIEIAKGDPDKSFSLNTYLVYALAQTALKNEKMRTYKNGQKLVVFKHADIGLPILKTLPNGVKVPVWYVLRKADTKSLSDISQELKKAIKSDLTDDKNVKFRRKLVEMPRWIQSLVYYWIFSNPIRMKKFFGNVGITNVRQLGYTGPFSGHAPGVYSCQVTVGNVTEKFLPDENKQPVLRKVITLGAGMDHVVMDGMCMSAIGKDFADILENPVGIS